MNPFHFLGLPIEADLAEVKRAYARLLRRHRPDEDPQGFQRVHEAYMACQEILRRRPPRPVPVAPAEPPPEADSLAPPRAEPAGDEPGDAPGLAADSPIAPPAPPEDPVRLAQAPDIHLSTAHASREPAADAHPEDPAIASPVVPPHTLPPRPLEVESGEGPWDPVAAPGADPARALPPPRPRDATVPPGPHDPVHQREPARPNLPPRPPAAEPVRIRFSVDEFLAEAFHRDADGAPALQAWLSQHAALYSLALKQALTLPLLQALIESERTLSPDGLRELLTFFGLDQLGPRQTQLENAVQALQARSATNWKLAPWLDPSASKGMRRREQPPGVLDRFVAQELLRPPNRMRRLAILLTPGLPKRLFRIMLVFQANEAPSPSPAMQRAAIAWWKQLADPGRLSPWRILMLLWRSSLLTGGLWWALARSEDDDYFFATMAVLLPLFWILVPFLKARNLQKANARPKPRGKRLYGGQLGTSKRWTVAYIAFVLMILRMILASMFGH